MLRPACAGHLLHSRGDYQQSPRTTRRCIPHGITGISSSTSPHTHCGIPERDRCPPAPYPGPVTNAALPARRIAQHPIRRSAFRPSTGPQEIWYPGRDRFRKTGRTPCPILPQSLRMLKSQLEKNHYPVKEENMRLFENVKEDDNLVLVFFKIKDL